MARPKHAWVLGKLWDIEWKPGFFRDEGCYGDCVHSQLRVRVDSEICDQQARDTLHHELIHAIEKELGLTLSEKTVRQLATVQVAVMRDNPDLMEFLLSGLETADE